MKLTTNYCYIIKELFFSLIIFYHSVWLGLELFTLRVQVHCHWVQFYARPQGMWQSPFAIINPQTGMDIMPGRDGPENLRILKKSQLRWDHGGRALSFLPLWRQSSFFGSWPAEMNWDLRHHKMRWALGWGQNSKNCVSLFVSKNRSQELNNCSYLKQQNPPVFVSVSVLLRGSLNKFPDFFRMGTFIDSTHIKL